MTSSMKRIERRIAAISAHLLYGMRAASTIADEKLCSSPVAGRTNDIVKGLAEALRDALPRRIILVRHGHSEGNADETLYRTKPDNRIELTVIGSKQALDAGRRIRHIIGSRKAHMFVSPFMRTLQTARNIKSVLDEGQVLRTHVDTMIREQEFGNIQDHDHEKLREEQKRVGRYWYRFPTGESGADVYSRVKQWWDSRIAWLNVHPDEEIVDDVIVVTHGLTMRFILMQLFGWSPNTFHTVWNADNCAVYVLRKDTSLPGRYPYVLDDAEGDVPRSTIDLRLEFKDGTRDIFTLTDYLKLKPPRTQRIKEVCAMLSKQHGIDPDSVASIDFWGGKYHKYM